MRTRAFVDMLSGAEEEGGYKVGGVEKAALRAGGGRPSMFVCNGSACVNWIAGLCACVSVCPYVVCDVICIPCGSQYACMCSCVWLSVCLSNCCVFVSFYFVSVAGVRLCLYVSTGMYMYAYKYLHIFVCIYMYIYVYIYTYLYI